MTYTMVMSQFEIGQRAFLSRLWTKHWITAQDEHQKSLKSRKHGITAIAHMIQHLQKLICELWYSRNDALHQNTQSCIKKERSIECDSCIDSLFQRQKTIPLRHLALADRKYFHHEIQSLKRMRLARRERWVSDTKDILDKYDFGNQTEQVRQFRAYFMHWDDG